MNAKESGFILKNYLPAKYQVTILNDRNECLQAGVLKAEIIEKLRPGYQVQYSLMPGIYYAKLIDIEIINVPLSVDYLNLEFLHQILELCTLIIPIGQITKGVIDLLKLLTSNQNSWSIYQKRLLVCCLLATVGFYPEVKSVHDYNFIVKISKIDATKIDIFSSFKFNI